MSNRRVVITYALIIMFIWGAWTYHSRFVKGVTKINSISDIWVTKVVKMKFCYFIRNPYSGEHYATFVYGNPYIEDSVCIRTRMYDRKEAYAKWKDQIYYKVYGRNGSVLCVIQWK